MSKEYLRWFERVSLAQDPLSLDLQNCVLSTQPVSDNPLSLLVLDQCKEFGPEPNSSSVTLTDILVKRSLFFHPTALSFKDAQNFAEIARDPECANIPMIAKIV